jgi:hypothetical protein
MEEEKQVEGCYGQMDRDKVCRLRLTDVGRNGWISL